MTYVMDTGPLIIMLGSYYEDRFPTLWQHFDDMRKAGTLVSVREVFFELEGRTDRISNWVKDNKSFFESPSADEMQLVADIFKVRHFQSLIKEQAQLQGKPTADPFVIAKAGCIDGGCVVTEEKRRPNAAKIPNVCDHFDIDHMSLEEFMEKENWTF